MKVLLRVASATLFACLWVFPHSAPAATLDGNQLLELCTGQDPICTGYIMGVADAKDRDQHGISFCIPDGVSRAQLKDVVVAYLQKNEGRRFPAALLVSGALAGAFACGG